MKYQQQVSVDLVNMVYTAIAYLALAGAAWLFLRLIQACFWLPSHMKRQNDVQRMLQEKVDSYERYIEECEAKEEAGETVNENDTRSLEEKRKERRECLDMLKRELNRIRDGGDPYDFDYLLNEEEKRLLEGGDDDDKDEKKSDTENTIQEAEEDDEKKEEDEDEEEEEEEKPVALTKEELSEPKKTK